MALAEHPVARPGAALIKGVIAGLVATLAVSILVIVKEVTNPIIGTDPITVFTRIGAGFGLPEDRATGWVLHVLTGTVLWGLLFGAVAPRFQGDPALKGILVGALIWVGTIALILPLLGAGFAGMDYGQTTPAVLLVMHLAYGSVLGGAYSALDALDKRRRA